MVSILPQKPTKRSPRITATFLQAGERLPTDAILDPSCVLQRRALVAANDAAGAPTHRVHAQRMDLPRESSGRVGTGKRDVRAHWTQPGGRPPICTLGSPRRARVFSPQRNTPTV